MDSVWLEKIEEFRAKAGCMHSQRRANRIWEEIRGFLPADEVTAIRVAWNHHQIGEGRQELDEVVGKVIKRWKGLTG